MHPGWGLHCVSIFVVDCADDRVVGAVVKRARRLRRRPVQLPTQTHITAIANHRKLAVRIRVKGICIRTAK